MRCFRATSAPSIGCGFRCGCCSPFSRVGAGKHGGSKWRGTEPAAGSGPLERKGNVNVLVLTPSRYDSAPGMRFRMEQWARHLARAGFTFCFEPFADEALHRTLYQPGHVLRKSVLVTAALLRRFAVIARAPEYDAIFLHREAALLGPAVLERLVAMCRVPLIYDFDDPV